MLDQYIWRMDTEEKQRNQIKPVILKSIWIKITDKIKSAFSVVET